MSAPRLRAAALALGLGLVITPALSGCIPSIDDVVGGIVQQGIEEGIEGLAGLDLAEGRMPDGFPSEVPVADGEVLGGAGVTVDEGKRGWVVAITTNRTAEDIQAQLAGAGLSAPEGFEGGEILAQGFAYGENDRYHVAVVIAEQDGKQVANYTVAEK